MSDKIRKIVQLPASVLSEAFASEAQIGTGASVPGMGAAPILACEPVGGISSKLRHPSFQPLERMFRVLPEETWFSNTVTANRPLQFPLGSYEVPQNMALWLMEYRFRVYRFSGIDAGDMLPSEEGRYADALGFDVTVSGRRPSDIQYQLDPLPVSFSRPQFDTKIGQQKSAAQFNRDAAQNFAAVASPGLSLLPNRLAMQGPSNGPFTFVVKEGDTVNLNAVIFRPFQTPVSCIEGQLAGYLLHVQMSDVLINRLRPR